MTAVPLTAEPTARRAARLPLVFWALTVVLGLVQLSLILASAGRPTPGLWGVNGWEIVLGLMFASVGAIIAARRPDNRVGWLLLAIGLAASVSGVLNWYGVFSDSRPNPLPAVDLVRWMATWAWVPFATAGITVVPLVFPDGRLPSARWRPALALSVIGALALVGAIMLIVEPLGPLPAVPVSATDPQNSPLLAVGFALFIAAAAVAGSSLIWRYRHADQVTRQQIKWVAYAFALLVPAAAIGFLGSTLGELIELVAIAAVVLSIAVAVLRYRLYEIDQIINRTLVYGFLTAILAGVYAASITLMQRLLAAVTDAHSDASIIFTTLIVVSLFTPLKTRLEKAVDRRLKTSTTAAPPALAASSLDTLARLDVLRNQGIVTQAEFDAKKAELLARL